jgi:hypothetical protein
MTKNFDLTTGGAAGTTKPFLRANPDWRNDWTDRFIAASCLGRFMANPTGAPMIFFILCSTAAKTADMLRNPGFTSGSEERIRPMINSIFRPEST